MDQNHIRNFCILAHIDHGKSTLADRLLELTGTIEKRKMQEQFLDMHPLEREKGITIKMQPVRMNYELRITNDKLNNSVSPLVISHSSLSDSAQQFVLNLIDTPGHVDFSYEVSRALAAVEGAILLVDATQGVQAQTLANLSLAEKEKLIIIPAVNKIDLPSAEIERTQEEIRLLTGIESAIHAISGKAGTGVDALLKTVIENVPAPKGDAKAPLRALIFDSAYDAYLGVVAHVRIIDGSVKRGEKIRFLATSTDVEALEIGVFLPQRSVCNMLVAGEIGYIATGIKEPAKVHVGDTITNAKFKMLNAKKNNSAFSIQHSEFFVEPLPGYREPEPMVFASIFPENQDEHSVLRDSLNKLKLNDAALTFEPEESSALGRGFRAGFLGMLHMEIVSERLRREYNLNLTFSNPSVAFKIKTRGSEQMIYTASKMPEPNLIDATEEPWASVELITPPHYLGGLTTLINQREGNITDTATLPGDRLRVRFEAPLRQIIIDFYDVLKSVTQGFASMSYEVSGYRAADLVRLDILVAGEKVLPLSEIVPREQTYHIGRARVEKLKELLPRELFAIAIQAEVEGRVIARETISALKKDVTGYLYGGDRTRKMKLWKKQQKGKKKLKERGRVDIPPDVFLKMLKKN